MHVVKVIAANRVRTCAGDGKFGLTANVQLLIFATHTVPTEVAEAVARDAHASPAPELMQTTHHISGLRRIVT